MHSGNPVISVIIPVYNCEKYLAESIGSVLDQTYSPLDIIVVDDGSKDQSANVAKGFSDAVRYIYQNNAGIGAARNTGVDHAKGDFLAFIDADDVWTGEKLRLQMAAFQSDDSLDMVFGQVIQFISPELPENVKNQIKCPPDKMPGRLPGAMLIRKGSFHLVGYFSLAIGEVLDWNLRAGEIGLKSITLEEVVFKRRLHSTNSVLLNPDSRLDYVRYLKASLDRRRNEKNNIK